MGDYMSDDTYNNEKYELDELSIDKVADITGLSKEEAKQNLKQLKKVMDKPEQIAEEDKELSRNMLSKAIDSEETFEATRMVVGSILSTESGAKSSGEITGATLSTLVEETPRILEGKASMGEVKKIGTTLASMMDAFKEGRGISRHVIDNLPTKQEMEEKKDTIDVEEVEDGEPSEEENDDEE